MGESITKVRDYWMPAFAGMTNNRWDGRDKPGNDESAYGGKNRGAGLRCRDRASLWPDLMRGGRSNARVSGASGRLRRARASTSPKIGPSWPRPRRVFVLFFRSLRHARFPR